MRAYTYKYSVCMCAARRRLAPKDVRVCVCVCVCATLQTFRTYQLLSVYFYVILYSDAAKSRIIILIHRYSRKIITIFCAYEYYHPQLVRTRVVYIIIYHCRQARDIFLTIQKRKRRKKLFHASEPLLNARSLIFRNRKTHTTIRLNQLIYYNSQTRLWFIRQQNSVSQPGVSEKKW